MYRIGNFCQRLLYILLISVSTFPVSSAHRNYDDSSVHSYIPPRPNSSKVVRQRLTRDTVLWCGHVNGTSGVRYIDWWYRGIGFEQIGAFDPTRLVAVTNWTREGAYEVRRDGSLLLRDARRELVERYDCVAHLGGNRQMVEATYFRLDFSFWYASEPGSLFWGSCLAAVIFCAASFLLNILWIICRSTILWWIKRTERLSRVRAMMVAMEKYRQKQMESLHENYARRVSTIRENYHSQVEQLRQSYAESADRFRGFRQEKIDNVQQHLDAIRENYYQQINRLREFGSRRVEQIWEGYDKSITAVRTFTLEQRLKILKQYKVKQRYVNKLLEAIGTETNMENISKKEAAIRDVLGEEEPPAWPLLQCSTRGGTSAGIARSASYYSLPDFVIEEEGGVLLMMAIAVEEQCGAQEEEEDQQPSTSSNATRETRIKFADETAAEGSATGDMPE